MLCKSSQLVRKELSPVLMCCVFNGYGLMPTVAICAGVVSAPLLHSLTHFLSIWTTLPAASKQLTILWTGHRTNSCFRSIQCFYLQVCLFFPSIPASLRSILVSPSAVGTCCSSALFLVSSCSCSLLWGLRDVFHWLSESHVNSVSAAAAVASQEAACTPNNYFVISAVIFS